HAARHVGSGRLDEAALFVQKKYRGDLAAQLAMFQAIFAGLNQKGAGLESGSAIGQWGAGLAHAVLNPEGQPVPSWSGHPLEAWGGRPFRSPWGTRHRKCADGRDALFFDSIVNGEQLTGILRSRPFPIPGTLSFWICGHNGLPETDPEPVNHVRLKLAAT